MNGVIRLPPGEAESGSAGVQPDKEYPGRRRTDVRGPEEPKAPQLFLGHIGRRSYASKTHRDPWARRGRFTAAFFSWVGVTPGSPFQKRFGSKAFFCRSI